MKQAQSLLNLPGAATIIDVTVDDIFAAKSVAARIVRLTGLKAESWMETNAQLMNALRSQSLSTQMISVFVALSVALGIASVLSVSVGPKLFYIPVDQTLLMGAALLATLTGIVSAALPARRASRFDPVAPTGGDWCRIR